MDHYHLFVLLAVMTVLSPGPGVVLTLSNSIRFGFRGAISGIFGVAFGTFAVAAVSATSLGLLLAVSTIAFSILKYVGAVYLIYLGIRLWCSNDHQANNEKNSQSTKNRRFVEGVTVQVTNPKAVFFFMSIFPQFIDYSVGFIGQFSLLVLTYSVLVVIIHMAYALIAESVRDGFNTPICCKALNKIGGGAFICFGVGLAGTNR